MNIFEYAMQMETDGENFYRDLAHKTNVKGLQTIFNILVAEEVKHFEILQAMQREKPRLPETEILSDAKNIFIQMKEANGTFGFAVENDTYKQPQEFDLTQIELYKKAQEIEQESMDFYRENAGRLKADYQQNIFLRLAQEEKKHYFLLENIIEFVSRPRRWLENAEFVHLEEY